MKTTIRFLGEQWDPAIDYVIEDNEIGPLLRGKVERNIALFEPSSEAELQKVIKDSVDARIIAGEMEPHHRAPRSQLLHN